MLYTKQPIQDNRVLKGQLKNRHYSKYATVSIQILIYEIITLKVAQMFKERQGRCMNDKYVQ